MIKILTTLSFVILTGCSTCQERDILIDQNYVLRKAPAELYVIPEYPTMDVVNATQADVADWVTRNEERSRELESKIQRLKDFFEKPPIEADKAPATPTVPFSGG